LKLPDWDFIRAYLSPVIISVFAFIGILKDAEDYRKLVNAGGSATGVKAFGRKHIVSILCLLTILLSVLSIFDTHSTRKEAWETRVSADKDQVKRGTQIDGLSRQLNDARKDAQINAKTFSDAFGTLYQRFSDLQARVTNQDLMRELAATQDELRTTQKKLTPDKALLQASFFPLSNGKPVISTAIHMNNGVAVFQLTFINSSNVDAVRGAAKIILCDACKFGPGTSGGYHLPADPNNFLEVTFDHIFANSATSPLTVMDIIPLPLNPDSLGVVVRFACESCQTDLGKGVVLRFKSLP
jgi:hypothetical protein